MEFDNTAHADSVASLARLTFCAVTRRPAALALDQDRLA
jgi:hypothetical protein